MDAPPSAHDRRAHPRLKYLVEVEVECRGVTSRAQLRDLSFGGARAAIERGLLRHGDAVRLHVPSPTGQTDGFDAEVIRIEENPDLESDTVGLRFYLVDEHQREQLRATLASFLELREASGRRAAPRLACRVDIAYETSQELRAILEDISRGGLAMTTPELLEVGQEVLLVLPDSSGDDLFTLRAVVVHSRESASGPLASRVGVRFTPMGEERTRLLEALLAHLGNKIGD